MATTLISPGPVFTMVVNIIYALAGRLCNYTVYTSGGTIEVSNDLTNWQAMTLDANKNFTSSAAYARSTGAGSLIVGKSN